MDGAEVSLLTDDPLDLVEGDFVGAAFVEIGRPRTRVGGHALRPVALTAVRGAVIPAMLEWTRGAD